MLVLHALGSGFFVRPFRWIAIAVLVGFRKWRILVGVLVAFVIVDAVTRLLQIAIGRPRPLVEIIGDWVGYSHPSRPMALLAVTFAVVGLALIPKSRWRTYWFIATSVLVALLGISRMYLGVDHPTDVWIGWLVGPAVGVVVFQLIAPESVFPISYGRGRSAHLDVTGRRGEAIRHALQDQLGVEVVLADPGSLISCITF